MPELSKPTVRLRRFGAELRDIRESLGLSLQAAARRTARSDSALSKLENGYTFMYPRDVDQILNAYGITDPARRRTLHTLMRDGRKKGWWQHYRDDLPPEAIDFMRLESDAVEIRSFQPLVIPGIVQHRDYASAMIATGGVRRIRNPGRILDIRMKRQEILAREDPSEIHLLIGEAAVRQLVGGPVTMCTQLRRLLEVSHLPCVKVRVLPFSAGSYLGMDGSYVLLRLPDHPCFCIVFREGRSGALWVEAEDEVAEYKVAFDTTSAQALSESDSRLLIERVVGEIERQSR